MKAFALVVGLAGVSGSGKTTIADALRGREGELGCRVDVLNQDGYYFEHGDDLVNWETPDLLDNARLVEDIRMWRRKDSTEPRVLLVEGFLVCAVQELREELDCCAFLHVSRGVSRLRRFGRDEWIQEHPEYFDVVWECYQEHNHKYPLQYLPPHFSGTEATFFPQLSPPLFVLPAGKVSPLVLTEQMIEWILPFVRQSS